MYKQKKVTITAHDMRRIAVEARCGERSVRTFFRGGRIKDLTRLRIVEAIATIGIAASEALAPTAANSNADKDSYASSNEGSR